MSYILDALKKAQAERQLGHAPTIHAPPPTYAPPAGRASRMPLLIGLGAGAAVAALGAVFLMRQPAPAPAVQVAAAPSAAARPATDVAPAVQAPAAPPAAAPALPEPAPAAAAPEPVKARESAPAKPAPAAAAPRKAEPAVAEAPPVAAPEPVRPAAAAVAPPMAPPVAAATPAPAPAVDDNVGPLAALPEAVQRDIPRVAFGGYIYSPNPAERLLLVDKMLRREGEEVAPGLVLERLLPKAAIMNYRGYRYRVAY